MSKEWPVQRYTDVTCGVSVTIERYATLLNNDDPDVSFRYSLWGVCSQGPPEEVKAAMQRGEQKAQFTAVEPITGIPGPAQAFVNMLASFGGGEVKTREGGPHYNSAILLCLPDGYDDVTLIPTENNANVRVEVRRADMIAHKTFPAQGSAKLVLAWVATARKKLKRARTIQEEAMQKTRALGITIEGKSYDDDD